MTSYCLIGLGHRSVLASTATAAYDHLRNPHEFELVLLDLQLGDQRSEPLMLRLREERIEIPAIVIFSAQPLAEIEHSLRQIGAKAYVQKPAVMGEIERALRVAVA